LIRISPSETSSLAATTFNLAHYAMPSRGSATNNSGNQFQSRCIGGPQRNFIVTFAALI
jgi:hypothetical protein